MRLVVAFVLIFIVTAYALPAKVREGPKCSRDCGEKYEPICAKAKNSSKERLLTFGNECVLSNYNCQHGDDQFEIKSSGECGGKVSVRLS